MRNVAILEKFGPLIALIFVVALFATADALTEEGGKFLTQRNFRVILAQTATVAVAALGMTIVILSGGIDLSAGTAIAFSATVLAFALREGIGVGPAILLSMLTGGFCGLINGALISLLRIVPFIATLGTMTIFLGCAKIVADETTVRPPLDQIPVWLSNLVSTRSESLWLGLPTGVWLAFVLSVTLAAVLHWTVFGRYVFVLGSNEQTARLCGINVSATKVAIYVISGLFIGIAGIYQFAKLSSGNPISGIGLELKVIAAVVIGGGSLSGGQGSVIGTLTGATIMGVIASGCTLLDLSNPIQDILLGVIIITAVSLDHLRRRLPQTN